MILPIYGPIGLQPYGICILLSLLLFMYALKQDIQFNRYITNDQLTDAISISIVSAIIGGRLLFVINNPASLGQWFDFFALWHGGFSVLGSLIGILLTVPFFFKYKRIPIIPTLDRIAIYAPVLQGLARIGCFFAGCCYGAPTNVFWAVAVDTEWVHPTQLYSCFNLLFIFGFLFYIAQYYLYKQGQLLSLYLILIGAERFFVDFLRAEHEIISLFNILLFSLNQWIALAIVCSGCYCFARFSIKYTTA